MLLPLVLVLLPLLLLFSAVYHTTAAVVSMFHVFHVPTVHNGWVIVAVNP